MRLAGCDIQISVASYSLSTWSPLWWMTASSSLSCTPTFPSLPSQPSNNARLLKDDLLNGEPIPSCQTKYNDDNNDDDVNEFNNDYVEVQHNNSKDTNTNAEASEETC